MSNKWPLEKVVKHIFRGDGYWSVINNQQTIIPVLYGRSLSKNFTDEQIANHNSFSSEIFNYFDMSTSYWSKVCNIKTTSKKIKGDYKFAAAYYTTEVSSNRVFTLMPRNNSKIPIAVVISYDFIRKLYQDLGTQSWAKLDEGVNQVYVARILMTIFAHEFGHVLELEHPGYYGCKHETSYKAHYDQDNKKYSIMSYIDHPAYQGVKDFRYEVFVKSAALHDIAVVQFKYGPNKSYHSGNNQYSWETGEPFFECIWDSAGIDCIDLSNQNLAAILDLRGGDHFSSVGPKIGNLKVRNQDNLTLAYGVDIENAVLSKQDDMFTFSNCNNTVTDPGGNDQYKIFDWHYCTNISQGRIKHYWKQGSGENKLKDNSGSNIIHFYFSGHKQALSFSLKSDGTLTVRDTINQSSIHIDHYDPLRHHFKFTIYDKKYLDPAQSAEKDKFDDIAVLAQEKLNENLATKLVASQKVLNIGYSKEKGIGLTLSP